MSNTILPHQKTFEVAAKKIVNDINTIETNQQSQTEQKKYKINNKNLLLSMSTRFKGLSGQISKIPILGQFSIVFDVFAFVVSFAEDDALTTLMIKTIEVLIQYLIFINVINRCRLICFKTIGCTYLDIAKKMIDYYETEKSNKFELDISSYKTIEMFALDHEILDEDEQRKFNESTPSSQSDQSKIKSDQSKIKEIRNYYQDKGKLPNYKQLEHLFRIIAIDTTSIEGDVYGFINVLKNKIDPSMIDLKAHGFNATFRTELFSVIQQRLTIFNSKMTILQNKFTNLLIQLNHNPNYSDMNDDMNNFLSELYKSDEYELFISPLAITLETFFKISNDSIILKDELDKVEIFSNGSVIQATDVVAGFGNKDYSLHGTYELSQKGITDLNNCKNQNSTRSVRNTTTSQSYKEVSNKLQVSSKGQQPTPPTIPPVKKKWFFGIFGGAKKTKSKTYNRRKNKRKGKKRITKKRKHNKNYN
jgi:hypothetical protein